MPHRWGHRPSWGGESAQQEPSKEKTGDPFIDQWIDQGGSWSIGADGSLILYKAGDRRSDPILQRIPNYFPDSEGGGGGYPPAHLDPRYWDLQYKQLEAEYMNMGLDRDAARQQALTTLIASRNNLAANVADTSAGVAKTAADYAANPRDAVAELMYRNAVGGGAPFGAVSANPEAAGQFKSALQDKFQQMFGGVAGDIQQARVYRDAIPLPEFLGSSGAAAPAAMPAAAPAAAPAAPNALQALMDQLNSFNPQQQEDFRRWTDPEYRNRPVSAAHGAQLDFEGLYKSRSKPGYSPASSEGGTNLNIHERAIVLGESGQIYATLGERRPDGSMRAEQLQVKPLKSEVEKDKKLQEADKAVVETQKQTMASFQQGGGITFGKSPDEFMEQLRQYLGGLGGPGGGTGAYKTPLPSLRLLAGAPANALAEDPVARDYTLAGYSALGIDPRTAQATIAKYTPQGIVNNSPRTLWA